MENRVPIIVDALIIGGGPAGLAAALWCTDLGLSAVLIEDSERLGGQLNWTHGAIKNFPGVVSILPMDLISKLAEQVHARSVTVLTGNKIERVNLGERTIAISDGTTYSGRGMIIATGVRRRRLNIPGEDDFQGKGILSSGKLERETVKGARVVIVGGGDAALENAIILGDQAASVVVVHRGREFSARKEFVIEAKARKNVEFLFGTNILSFSGRRSLEGVVVSQGSKQQLRTLPSDFALIRIGVEPNSELFSEELSLMPGSYIDVNSRCLTSIPLVFAIGDVARTDSPTIPSAVGMAATAAKNLERLLAQT